MGENIFKVNLGELNIVRFVCAICHNAVEFTADNPPQSLRNGNCPCCAVPTSQSGVQPKQFVAFLQSLAILRETKTDGVGAIQFPIKLPSE